MVVLNGTIARAQVGGWHSAAGQDHWYEKLWGTGAGAGIEWTQVRIQPRWNGVIELTIFLGLQGSDSAQDTTLGNTISHAIEATVSALANRSRLAEPLCLAWTLIL